MVIQSKDTNKIALKLLAESKEDFITRDYQLDLIDNSLKNNTVICSDNYDLKTFIMILLIKKFSVSTDKNIIIFCTDENKDFIKQTVNRHCNIFCIDIDTDKSNFEQIRNCVVLFDISKFEDTAVYFRMASKNTSLLIFTDCKLLLDHNSYLYMFLSTFDKNILHSIQIYGLNGPLIDQEILGDKIEYHIKTLETLLNCHVDIGTESVQNMACNHLEEETLYYSMDFMKTKLFNYISNKIQSSLDFLFDIKNIIIKQNPENIESFTYCEDAFKKCQEILESYGTWCCCVIAKIFIKHFLRMNFTNISQKFSKNNLENTITREDNFSRVQRNCVSTLSEIVRISVKTFDTIEDFEEFKSVMSPKIVCLLELLKKYKSSLNFKIEAIKLPSSSKVSSCKTDESISDLDDSVEGLNSDFSSSDADSIPTDDENPLVDRGGPTFRPKIFTKRKNKRKKVSSHHDSTQKTNKLNSSTSSLANISSISSVIVNPVAANRFLFRAVIPENSTENFEKMCSLIYVKCAFSAYALSRFLEEIVNWDPDLFFLHPGHVFSVANDSQTQNGVTVNQEETINQMRRGLINCLVTTSIVDSAKIQLPNCNLVVQLDPVDNLAQYFCAKARIGTINNSTINMLRRANSSVAEAITRTSQHIFYSDTSVAATETSTSVGAGPPHSVQLKYVHIMSKSHHQHIKQLLQQFQLIEQGIKQRSKKLTQSNNNNIPSSEDLTKKLTSEDIDMLEPPLQSKSGDKQVKLSQAISLVNLYCARLPTDIFTKLTPCVECECTTISSNNDTDDSNIKFRAVLTLPINSPYRLSIKGNWMDTKQLAKMSAAFKTIRELYNLNELDHNFCPWNKEDNRTLCGNESSNIDEEYTGLLVGTSKRRHCYHRGFAKCLTTKPINQTETCYLYSIDIILSRQIPEEQNVKGRQLMISQNESRGFGLLCASKGLEKTLKFPVFTRSGEEEVEINEVLCKETESYEWSFTEQQYQMIMRFHDILFSSVFRLKMDKCIRFDPANAIIKLLIVPVNQNCANYVDWEFINMFISSYDVKDNICKLPTRKKSNGVFDFDESDYKNAVVMPSYRNFDHRQYYYVADICHEMRPTTDFPGEHFSTFAEYYTKKYGAKITNYQQPLLDADFSVMRLNMTTPRHVNFKGMPLPLPSEAKKKSMRESINQKQFLIPELCFIHPFTATLWHKAACLPTILYRVNQLLLAEELRYKIAVDVGLGSAEFDRTNIKLLMDYNLSGGSRHGDTNGVETTVDNCASSSNGGTITGTTSSRFNEDLYKTKIQPDEELVDNRINDPISDSDFGEFKADAFIGENEREYFESTSDVESVDSFDLGENLSMFVSVVDSKHHNNHPGPQVILEAVTMLCSSDFINLERMETVGDSFLKYASTVSNFLLYPSAHEGRLSHLRSKQVANSTLYLRARDKSLAIYLNSSKFNPHDNWIFPGYSCTLATDRLDNILSENCSSFSPKIHHFLTDKNLADVVESLIGCYLTSRNEESALRLMQWFNIDCIPLDTPADQSIKPLQIELTDGSSAKANYERFVIELEGLEKLIDYQFNDKAYLIQAMTHSSYHLNDLTDCYQRLELLGDAVLDYVITRYLYDDCHKHSPGDLTDLRSALVNNNIFAALVVKFNIYKYFYCISPELWRMIDRFVHYQKVVLNDELDFVIHYDSKHQTTDNTDEDVEIPKCLGDIFESLAGAVFLDCGRDLRVVWRVFHPLFKERIVRYTSVIPKSPVRKLLELMPEIVNFETPKRTADGRTKVCVRVIGKGRFYGYGRNYRIAKSVAAKKALKTLLFEKVDDNNST